jgi:hypothetical protein
LFRIVENFVHYPRLRGRRRLSEPRDVAAPSRWLHPGRVRASFPVAVAGPADLHPPGTEAATVSAAEPAHISPVFSSYFGMSCRPTQRWATNLSSSLYRIRTSWATNLSPIFE